MKLFLLSIILVLVCQSVIGKSLWQRRQEMQKYQTHTVGSKIVRQSSPMEAKIRYIVKKSIGKGSGQEVSGSGVFSPKDKREQNKRMRKSDNYLGFAKKKSTGTVDRSKDYIGGRQFIGVDAKFKQFKADAHNESFQKMAFFNKEKLYGTMSFSLQYFLMPGELKSLHDAYGLSYRSVLRSTVRSAIKLAALQFTVNEYRKERQKVEAGFFRAAKIALGGTCCYKSCSKYVCLPGCGGKHCTKGLFAYLKYFQLEEVDIMI